MAKKAATDAQNGGKYNGATVLTWLKGVGDSVELDEPIAEIATDKVDSEVPSEFEGIIVELPHNEGDVVQVGDILCVIATEGDDTDNSNEPLIHEQEKATEPEQSDVPYIPEKTQRSRSSQFK